MQDDPVAQVIALTLFSLVGVAVLVLLVAEVARRDPGWLVIARGLVSGRAERYRRYLRGARRG